VELLGRAVELQQVEPEAGTVCEALTDRIVDRPLGWVELGVAGGRSGEADVLAEVESHPPVAATQRPSADPDELAAGAELIEPDRAVLAQTAREHVALPGLRCERHSLQRDQGLAQPIRAGSRPAMGVDVLPAGQEPGQLSLVRRLHLLAQPCQARPAQPAQDVRLAPLARGPTWEELAPDESAGALQLAKSGGRVDAIALGELPGRERDVGGRVAPDERDQRVVDGLEEALGQSGRRRHPECVAVEAGVLRGDVALLAGDPDQSRAALLDQLLEHRLGRIALFDPLTAFVERQVAEPAEDLLEAVAVLGASRLR
jgi:hypothetical protein